MVELRNKNYAAAAGPLTEAAKLSPSNWKYLDNLAYVQSQTGEVQPAIANYEVLSRLDPEALLPYLERARLHLQQGDVGNVRTILEHVANLIEDEDIAKGANNSGEWFFPAGEETVYLSNLPAKRAYVHSSCAAILYVVGEEESAEHATHLIPKLSDGHCCVNGGRPARSIYLDARLLSPLTLLVRIHTNSRDYLKTEPLLKRGMHICKENKFATKHEVRVFVASYARLLRKLNRLEDAKDTIILGKCIALSKKVLSFS